MAAIPRARLGRRGVLTVALVGLVSSACSSAGSGAPSLRAEPSGAESASGPTIAIGGSASPTPALPAHVSLELSVGPGPVDVAAGYGSIWVTNHHGASVTRLDPGDGRVLATIPVGTQPASMTVGAGSVWTANYDGTISRIDPTTNRATSVGNFPYLCGWPTVAGGAIWVYVCDIGQDYVARVDIATGKTTARIPAGPNQSSLLEADGALWMTTFPSGKMLRLNPATGAVLRTLAIPDCPIVGRQSAGFGGLWVSQFGGCSDSTQVLRLNPRTGAVEARFDGVQGTAVSVTDDALWIGNTNGGIDRIDPVTHVVLKWADVAAPDGIEAAYGSIWAVSFDAGTLWRVSTQP